MRAESLWPQIEPLLLTVEKPSRYINHEWHATHVGTKAPYAALQQTNTRTAQHPQTQESTAQHPQTQESTAQHPQTQDYRAALLYPDTYEIGQSNQAIAILYEVINNVEGCVAERVFLPWVDMIAAMRERDIPLFSLESAAPVASFDLLGITLPHTLAATNVLEALSLAGLPLHADKRDLSFPLVIGGGPESYNPEPLAAFFDAFLIGEGEEALAEVVRCHKDCLEQKLSKTSMLYRLCAIPGVYVPAFYDVCDNAAVPKDAAVPALISKRVLKDFDAWPQVCTPIVPFSVV